MLTATALATVALGLSNETKQRTVDGSKFTLERQTNFCSPDQSGDRASWVFVNLVDGKGVIKIVKGDETDVVLTDPKFSATVTDTDWGRTGELVGSGELEGKPYKFRLFLSTPNRGGDFRTSLELDRGGALTKLNCTPIIVPEAREEKK